MADPAEHEQPHSRNQRRLERGTVFDFRELMEKRGNRIRGIILRWACQKVRDPDLREDLVQQVLLRVLTSQAQFPDEAHAIAFLRRTWHSVLVDHIRKSSRQPVVRVDFEALGEEVANRGAAPDSEAYGRIELEFVHAVFSDISEKCRELWGLLYVEDLSYGEARARLSIKKPAFDDRIYQCRQKLKTRMQELGWDRGA